MGRRKDKDASNSSSSAANQINVTVLVLGDVGRSPRMQYHAQSLAAMSNVRRVDVVGYAGSELVRTLRDAENVVPHRLEPVSVPAAANAFFLTRALVKIVVQIAALLRVLFFDVAPPHYVLVQNPPAIPTLAVVWLVCILRRSRLVVDWHNYGYSLLEVSFRARREPLDLRADQRAVVRLAHWYEGAFGRLAHAHLCVTAAMRADLRARWGIRARTLHDAPPLRFRPRRPAERDALLREFAVKLRLPQLASPSRPAVLVSSTSWGDDEDFSLLLDAVQRYDRLLAIASISSPLPRRISGRRRANDEAAHEPTSVSRRSSNASTSSSHRGSGTSTPLRRDSSSSDSGNGTGGHEPAATSPRASGGDDDATSQTMPPLCVIITGRGERQEYYMQRFAALKLIHVVVRSVWLSAADYPRLLAAADLGLSFHYSSSGLDLPMKVVDMFGCSLPVCAVGFNCLDELVIDGKNGFVFSDANQLCTQMQTLLRGFPRRNKKLHYMREFLQKTIKRWDDNWNASARKIFVKY